MAKRSATSSSLWARTREPLLWLAGCGHERRHDPSYWWDCRKRHDRPHIVLQLTLRGAGFYERNGVRHLLPAGTAFLDRIPGDFRYGYPPGFTDVYEQVFVCATGPEAERLARSIIRESGPVLPLGMSSPLPAMMLSLAHQYSAGALHDRYQVSGMLYQLFMAVQSALKTGQMQRSQVVNQAIRLIEDCSQDHRFTVQHLAVVLDCSREHLSRRFHDATGVSVGEYLIQHRLEHAATLLRKEEIKLEAIAQRSGFASANYLCRAFRKRYGITPAQFRRTPWLVAR
jgi:AraC-like DNA-binding protein